MFDFYQDSLPSVSTIIAADFNGDTYMDGTDSAEVALADFNGEGYAVQADVAAMFFEGIYA